MPLNERVGDIFVEDEGARETFSNSLKRFLVKDTGIFEPSTDTVRNELSVVLLVESPHTHEVGYGYPLAGNTGRYVRKVLNGGENRLPGGPIGRFVRDGRLGGLVNNPEFLLLGIMNVSQLPFQGVAYDCIPWGGEDDCRNSGIWKDYLKCMRNIKDKYCTENFRGFKYLGQDGRQRIGRLRDERNQLYAAITNDLIGRLEYLNRNNPDVRLVCCGKVAQKFYRKTDIHMPNTCNLPHPSYSKWQMLNDEERQCLRNIRDLLWSPQQE